MSGPNSKRKHEGGDEVSGRSGRKLKKPKILDDDRSDGPESVPAEKSSGERLGTADNASEDSKSKLRKLKLERRKARRVEANPLQEAAIQTGALDATTDQKRPRREKSKRHIKNSSLKWAISEAIGGSLIELDPLFSPDETHIILAYSFRVKVYASGTSSCLRSLLTSGHGTITGIALSSETPSHLFISLSAGRIEKWDWMAGERLSKWDVKSGIQDLAVSSIMSSSERDEVIYTVDAQDRHWKITAHRLRSANSGQTELVTLFRCEKQITNLKIFRDGKVIVASAGKRLIIGALRDWKAPVLALKNLVYVWRETDCPEWIISLDARLDRKASSKGKGRSATLPLTAFEPIDVVVGGQEGSIFLYNDFLGGLIKFEREKTSLPRPRRMHWHRNAVASLKWSTDGKVVAAANWQWLTFEGNYVISGGKETVLCIWQLDTGKNQFLPSLSSAIESIVVAPSGSAYALRLADNSTMVLSTLDLQPKVSVMGLKLSALAKPRIRIPKLTYVSSMDRDHKKLRSRRSPVISSPSSPNELLLAVPATISNNDVPSSASAVFLQTYDIKSDVQVSNQALTRTKITDRVMGPEANIIREPDVVLLQVSYDGKWLATVDEWSPPTRDLEPLTLRGEHVSMVQESKTEIYLKFWAWDAITKTWELAARIESPHSTDDPGTGRGVLDLVADPLSCGFVTFGEDGMAKVWKPKARYRNGLEVRGKDKQVLVNWACHTVIPICGGCSVLAPNLLARLSFSMDGSLLAIGYQSEDLSAIYIVDMVRGKSRSVHYNLFHGPLCDLGIVDRYLVILSDNLRIWDLVDDQLHYSILLSSTLNSDNGGSQAKYLAINQKQCTLAVAFPTTNVTSSGSTPYQLAVFNPAKPEPLYKAQLSRPVLALVASSMGKEYFTVDVAAEVRTIAPMMNMSLTVQLQKEEAPLAVTAGLENIYIGGAMAMIRDDEEGGLESKHETTAQRTLEEAGEESVVRQHHLTEIFNVGTPFALPSVATLFEQVAGLFSRKSVTIST